MSLEPITMRGGGGLDGREMDTTKTRRTITYGLPPNRDYYKRTTETTADGRIIFEFRGNESDKPEPTA